MATTSRASGLTITVPDTFQIADGDPATSLSRAGRSRFSGPIPVPRAAAGGDDGATALLAAFRRDLVLIDQVELQPNAGSTPRDASGPSAPPGPPRQHVRVDVVVADGENAVLLIEQDGRCSWQIPTATSTAAAPPARSSNRLSAGGKEVRFDLEIRANRQVPVEGRRGFASALLYGRIRVHALKFVASAAMSEAGTFSEPLGRRGLIDMAGTDPSGWDVVQPRSVAWPPDRAARILLFVHGMFSSTIGSYGSLGATPWGQAFLQSAATQYDAILGFDHATLAADPLSNATELLAALEAMGGAHRPRVDTVAFGRGGLVFRALVEHVVPKSSLRCRFDRAVFVGCANGGTPLASRENWQMLADIYTNLAVAAFRLLSLFPRGASPALILEELVRGLGAFVKHLAANASSDLPGLSAMRPDGHFIGTLDQPQAGPPERRDLSCFAITSAFEPDVFDERPCGDLPAALLFGLADGVLDEAMKDPNDLVVSTGSMVALGRALLRDSYAFEASSGVYHTGYFTRPETASALARWFRLPRPAETAFGRTRSRAGPGAGASRPSTMPPLAAPRDLEIPASVDTNVLVFDAQAPAAEAAAAIASESPSYLIVERAGAGERLRYIFRPEEILAGPLATSHAPLIDALGLTDRCGSLSQSLAQLYRQPQSDRLPSPGRSVVLANDLPIGVVREQQAMTGLDIAELARIAAAPTTVQERVATRRAMPTFTGRAMVRAESIGSGASRMRSMTKAPPAVAVAPQIECHFAAEMDEEVVLNHSVTVEVQISREEIARASGAAADRAVADVDASQKLLVQAVPRTNFVLMDSTTERVEVDPPGPGAPTLLYFDLKGVVPGDGEVWILVRQRQMGIARLVLTPRVVERRAAAIARRATAETDAPGASALAKPVDQLLIIEQTIGEAVQYLYELDMPSIGVFGLYPSKPLKARRDDYVKALYKEIEGRYSSSYSAATRRADVEAFTAELQSYGASLFQELFPADVQDLLWKHRAQLASIRVVSTEPYIPWEVVHLKEPGRPLDTAAPSMFFGQLGLVRWLHNVNGLPPVSLRLRRGRTRFVIPDYPHDEWKLPGTARERDYLVAAFNATPIEPQPNPVRKVLTEAGSFDLLHFACHGEAEPDNINAARIVLEGRVESGNFVPTFLNAATVETFANLLGPDGAQPMVFLNACQTGRAGYKLTGIGGFAQAFLSARAGAFVGTLWSVGDEPAFDFGEQFYSSLGGGATISAATVAAREAARKAGDATWLAYVVYGHPHATVSP